MRIRKFGSFLLGVLLTVLVPAAAFAAGPGYSLFGDAMLVSPGFASPTAAQIRSSTLVSPGYGGVDFTVPAGTTFSDIQNLATDYMFTQGSCAGGAPRFVIGLTNGTSSGNISIYIGPPPNYTLCPPNVWTNTANLAAPVNLVDDSQLPGGTFYDPYFLAQVKYGSYTVTDLFIVTDSDWVVGNDPQTVRLDNVMINDTTYTFEGVDACKKDGWQQFTSAPGPFKNQGACVSYFARNK
jgi:hypothetical protein